MAAIETVRRWLGRPYQWTAELELFDSSALADWAMRDPRLDP